MNKCGRISCIDKGLYQPLIRIRAAILPASGNDVLAVIRLPFALCPKHRLEATRSEILDVVPEEKMAAAIREAKAKTGASPNPDRTDIHWVRLLGV